MVRARARARLWPDPATPGAPPTPSFPASTADRQRGHLVVDSIEFEARLRRPPRLPVRARPPPRRRAASSSRQAPPFARSSLTPSTRLPRCGSTRPGSRCCRGRRPSAACSPAPPRRPSRSPHRAQQVTEDYGDEKVDQQLKGPAIKFDGRGRGHDQEYDPVQGKYKVTPDYREEAELLCWEHNLLSEAFVSVTTCPGIECKEELLVSLLKPLNKIWTQPEWDEEYMSYTYHLSGLLCNDQFMETICLLVKSFEEEIKGSKIEHSTGTQEKYPPTSTTNYLYSSTFPKLMIALLLRILHFIHMAWMDRGVYDLPEIIRRAKLITTMEISTFLKDTNTLPANDGVDVRRMNTIGTWLREIRETGYNVIGLCASVERSIFGLDRSLFIDALVMDISSMDFDHVGKLIQLTFH